MRSAGSGRAFLAGLGVTAVLQTSTATALMVGSFAAAGAVALAPALAAMLGANVGTALIVQLLSFDVAAVYPALVLAGVLAFRRGKRARTRDLGRVSIGLGLMLLALHLMVATMAPVEASPDAAARCWRRWRRLAAAPICCWPPASPGRRIPASPAVLFVASLAGSGVVAPEAAFAMVLGANLGSALNPLLEAGGDREDAARLRVPAGNLINRVAGCGARPAAAAAGERLAAGAGCGAGPASSPMRISPSTWRPAVLALPLLPAWPRLLRRLLPDRPPPATRRAALPG